MSVVSGPYSIQSVAYPSQDLNIAPNRVNVVGSAAPKQLWVLHPAENDTFIITSVRTGLHLSANGDQVVVSPRQTKWNIVHEGKGPDGRERYKLQLNGVGTAAKLTGPHNEAPVVLVNFTKKDDELWHLNRRENLD